MRAGVKTVLQGGLHLALSLTLAAIALAGCGGERTTNSAVSSGGFPRVVGTQGRSLGRYHFPRGIDISPSNLLAITDKTGRVQILDLQGRGILEWNMPKMDNGTPTGLIFDTSDPTTETLIVADTHNSRIMRYGLGGNLMGIFGEYGGEPGHLIYPTDVAVDAQGRMYITEYGEHDRVLKFDRDGKFIKEWGDYGEEPGKFQRPLALILAPPDRIIVADSCNHRIQTFTVEGEFISVWGEAGRAAGQLNYPYDLVLGKDGLLYIVEFGNNRVQCFTTDGTFKGAYGKAGREAGEFGTPWGIAVAPDGLLYVADTFNHRLQVLEPEMLKAGGGQES